MTMASSYQVRPKFPFNAVCSVGAGPQRKVTVLYNSSFDLPKRRRSVLPPLTGAIMVACGTPPRSSIPPAKTGCQIRMVALEATPVRSHSHGSQVSQREQVDIDPFPPHFLTAASIRSVNAKIQVTAGIQLASFREKLLFN
jgi:hypothetical protein